MFLVRICKEKQLLDIKHYKIFQNALADVIDGEVFQNIPNDLFRTLGKTEMLVHSFSEKTGAADDFEFRYSNGITVYIGEIGFADTDNH